MRQPLVDGGLMRKQKLILAPAFRHPVLLYSFHMPRTVRCALASHASAVCAPIRRPCPCSTERWRAVTSYRIESTSYHTGRVPPSTFGGIAAGSRRILLAADWRTRSFL